MTPENGYPKHDSDNERDTRSRDNSYETTREERIKTPMTKGKIITLAAIGLLLAALIGLAVWLWHSTSEKDRALEEAMAEKEQILLDQAQRELDREYENLNSEFAQFEDARMHIQNDSVKQKLEQNYERARLQVEQLEKELKNQKSKSAAEIKKLRDEISSLRKLLKHYVEEIDRLNKENMALRSENEEIRQQNDRLNNQVAETSRRNEVLNERMTLAEKLNVTGITLTALKKNGNREKKISKAKQLQVQFTIPQNNSTPVGEKTIYLRLSSPSGQLLGNGGTFSFEGGNVACTAKKTIEYAGEEIGGVTIYYDVDTPLIPGEYTVELFADNYRLYSKRHAMK